MICDFCKQPIDSKRHGIICEPAGNTISTDGAQVTTNFSAPFASEPACKVSDPTTDAIRAITDDRARMRRVISVLEDEKREQGTALAIARRDRNGAVAARDVALERADRIEREANDLRGTVVDATAARATATERADRLERDAEDLRLFKRAILAALRMPENGDAISKVRALMSHDRTDVLEHDLASVRAQFDIAHRKLGERDHTIEVREQQIERQAKMLKEIDLERAALENQINAAHRILEKRALPPGDLITRLQALADVHQGLADDRMRLHRELSHAHSKAQRLERACETARALAGVAEREMNEHREARSDAEHRLHLADEARAYTIKRGDATQAVLDGFMSACADQTIQIMELRAALREVKPDHPMFGGSAQIPPDASGTTKA